MTKIASRGGGGGKRPVCSFNRRFLLSKKLASFFAMPMLTMLLEVLRTRNVDLVSIGRHLSLLMTCFSCIPGMDRTRALISLTVFETGNKKHMDIWLASTHNILRVAFLSRSRRAHALSSVAKSSLTQLDLSAQVGRKMVGPCSGKNQYIRKQSTSPANRRSISDEHITSYFAGFHHIDL